MTQEQMATALELALYRVGDKLKSMGPWELQQIGFALRDVADEFHKIASQYPSIKLEHGK